MTSAFSNNATPNYLGYVYQVLIAIEKCFDAKPNGTIWIECYGDIYDGHTFTEVKHHCKAHNLSNNSKDFWNTLKNLVVEDSSQFDKIVLHTTSFISEESVFYCWNTLDVEGRFKIIQDYEPSLTTKKYYETIFNNATESEIKIILSKFTIEHSKLTVENQWNKLLDMVNLKCLVENYREHVLHWIYSYVNSRAIKDSVFWRVNVNDFYNAFQFQVSRWSGDKIPFPIDTDKYDSKSAEGFGFLTEYKYIGLKAVDRGLALNDYFRTKKSEMYLIGLKPDSMPEIISIYVGEVIDLAIGYKREFSYSFEVEDINSDVSKQSSRSAYFKFFNGNILGIPEVSNTSVYFMRGKIHDSVNEGVYTWKYSVEDLI